MKTTTSLFALPVALLAFAAPVSAQNARPDSAADADVQAIVSRLELEKYKSTIKGLTQFGDRRQGTDRNRAAVDWIEAQLKSYGCTNTERVTYEYAPAARGGGAAGGGAGAAGRGNAAGGAAGAAAAGRGGAAGGAAGAAGAAGGAGAAAVGRGAGRGAADTAAAGGRAGGAGGQRQQSTAASGGGKLRGIRARTGVNNDSLLQPDLKLRALNSQPSTPGQRQLVFCTKIGSVHPEEMYIVGAHMDGIGWGEAANDDGSGTAIVMELARVLNSPDVKTDRSIRFALWNNEETGLNGARAYVDQRAPLQGQENPVGSGKYPEPKWLGMIQHDMMMFDHGMPLADGTLPKEQRPEADVNIEFQVSSKMAAQSQALAWAVHAANTRFATDYPASVGPYMTNTDSGPFQDLVAAISLRENERGTQIGAGWDPHWHQPTDVFATFSDKDFRLGLNAAQSTLGALGRLTGATLVK